jgi:multiple sugar transport system permease protein
MPLPCYKSGRFSLLRNGEKRLDIGELSMHKRFKLTLTKRKIMIAWLFIIPVLLVRLLTTVYPMITVFYYSFLKYDLIQRIKKFAGLLNYIGLSRDVQFYNSLKFTAIFTIFSTLAIIVFGIFLALLMKTSFIGRKIVRTVILIPWGMPMIVTAIAANWAFNDTYGIVNDLIRRTVDSQFHFPWITSVQGSQVAVIMVNVWKNTPFFAVMMLAAFQGVPLELYESAKIDGANNVATFFRITLPFVLRSFIIVTIFVGVWQISSFDIVYAMTKGGPGTATSLLAYRLYAHAIQQLNYGSASAITVVMFIMAAAYGLFGLWLYRKVDY